MDRGPWCDGPGRRREGGWAEVGFKDWVSDLLFEDADDGPAAAGPDGGKGGADGGPSLYVRVRQWFQPYWRPRPEGAGRRPAKKAAKKAAERPRREPPRPSPIKTSANRIGSWQEGTKPALDTIFFHRDGQVVQALGHFGANGRARFSGRDGRARRKVVPEVRLRGAKGTVDRAHLIPFGYHGHEGDPRIYVGWSKEQNQNQQNRFEERVGKRCRRTPIYWYTEVRKVSGGATWTYEVYDASDPDEPVLLDSLRLKQRGQFVWPE